MGDKLNNLVICDTAESDLPSELWHRLTKCATSVTHISRADSDFVTALSGADGLVLRVAQGLSAEEMAGAPGLRYVGILATGYGRIDIDAAKSRNITVTNVADYSTESVAELALAGALLFFRNLPGEIARASAGDVDDSLFEGRELSSLRVGIIGAGAIGSRTARLFASVGSTVSYWSRSPKPALDSSGVQRVSTINELCAKSDLVSVHLALNSDTTSLIDGGCIGSIASGSVLINTAPNEVLDMRRVLERCAADELAFMTDHVDEIPSEEERLALIATRNVIALPPIGYATREAARLKVEILVANLEGFVAGTPTNVVG